jgi:hypothetical protein
MAAVLVVTRSSVFADAPAQAVGQFWPDRLEIVVTFATDWRGAWVGGHPMLRDTHLENCQSVSATRLQQLGFSSRSKVFHVRLVLTISPSWR